MIYEPKRSGAVRKSSISNPKSARGRRSTLRLMKLIVGLGNPGADYEKTRHNAGWMVVEAFARKFRIDLSKHEKESYTGTGRVAGGSVVVAKPLTYMNLSGDAVKLLVNAYTESLNDLIVVYDD